MLKNKYSQKLSQPLLERFPIILNLRHEGSRNDLEIDNEIRKSAEHELIYLNKDRINNKITGEEMHNIINVFFKIKDENISKFIWKTPELDLFYKKSSSNNYSIRIKKQLKQITETIAIIEAIKKFYLGLEDNNKDRRGAVKNVMETLKHKESLEILIKEEFILEAFSYRETIS